MTMRTSGAGRPHSGSSREASINLLGGLSLRDLSGAFLPLSRVALAAKADGKAKQAIPCIKNVVRKTQAFLHFYAVYA
jgi:hypothetical protein